MIINAQQDDAIKSEAKETIVLAGPGSGKTLVIVARIHDLIRRGVSPDRIAVVTFTNAAATEIENRIQAIVPIVLGYCGTLHGFCLGIINQFGATIGMRTGQSVITNDRALEIVANLNVSMRLKINGVRAMQIVMDEQPKNDLNEQKLWRAFRQELEEYGLLTFGMILEKALEIVSKRHVPWDHLLVDEYQDSGVMDQLIYDALQVWQKFYVGDPDQAIYGFRGGSVHGIMGKAWGDDCMVVRLECNYRSGSVICDTAQRLIEHSPHRIPKQTVSMVDEKGKVSVAAYETAADEQGAVAGFVDDFLHHWEPEEVAVLLRTNALVQEYATALRDRGIKVRQRKWVERPADWPKAMAVLSVMANPENDRLAMDYIAHIKGPEAAAKARKEALGAFASINQHSLHLPAGVDLDGGLLFLSNSSVSLETRMVIIETARKLPSLGSTLNDLLIALQGDEMSESETGEGVLVTTIHAAKGREWDVVIFPAFEQEVIPKVTNPVLHPETVSEERRVAYVGLTRVKHTAIFTYAKKRPQTWGKRELEDRTPSMFLGEMGFTVCDV
jgi:superfamily I DNA/RNA helicase